MEERLNNLRERCRDYKSRSRYTYKTIAERIGIPYNSFRNFLSGTAISEQRYMLISVALDELESKLPGNLNKNCE